MANLPSTPPHPTESELQRVEQLEAQALKGLVLLGLRGAEFKDVEQDLGAALGAIRPLVVGVRQLRAQTAPTCVWCGKAFPLEDLEQNPLAQAEHAITCDRNPAGMTAEAVRVLMDHIEAIARQLGCTATWSPEHKHTDCIAAALEKQKAELAAGAAAQKAVAHVLNRRQLNPDLGYYIGYGTESFDLLCAAEALVTGEPVEVVQERRSKDLQPPYRKTKRRELQLEERIAELERQLEAAHVD